MKGVFPFLELSAEMRNAIYESTLDRDNRTANTALLRVCKQIHSEYQPMLAPLDTFSITVTDSGRRKPTLITGDIAPTHEEVFGEQPPGFPYNLTIFPNYLLRIPKIDVDLRIVEDPNEIDWCRAGDLLFILWLFLLDAPDMKRAVRLTFHDFERIPATFESDLEGEMDMLLTGFSDMWKKAEVELVGFSDDVVEKFGFVPIHQE